MTESTQKEASTSTAPGLSESAQEFYEEPPLVSAQDAIGVLVALVLLAAIGVAGYVWLTPGLGFSDLLPGRGRVAAGGGSMAAADSGAQQDAAAAGAAHVKCAQCGMFADKSASHIKATWSDGSGTDHDSWGCVANYASEQGLTLTAASVVDYDSVQGEDHEPAWLNAASAWYVTDAASVAGSMPPYIAAFSTEDAARQGQVQLGGEVRDFDGMTAQLGFKAYAFIPAGAGEGGLAEERDHGMGMEHTSAAEPDMEIEKKADMPPAAAEPADGAETATDAGRLDPLAAPNTHDHDMSCPNCGMPADASPSEVVVIWSNGDHEHFDSWDCLFTRAADEGLTIVRGVARVYGDMDQEPRWVEVRQARYLYDVNKIKMSMPPYVAAFETAADAEAAQPELGGELVSFAELQARWE